MIEPSLVGSPWQEYPPTYRAAEMRMLARWIAVGASGSVLALKGSGRSNLLGFLCHRADVVATYIDLQKLAVVLVPVDLGDLPSNTLTDLYRVILRAFYEAHDHFPQPLRLHIVKTYTENRTFTDPFLAQSALRTVLLHLQSTGQRVVLVVDRFDALCRLLTPDMAQALGVLRDTFRDTLSYIVGIRQSLAYLEELELTDDLYTLLTTHICYLPPHNAADARFLIERRIQMSDRQPSEAERALMTELTGGYPALLNTVCRWWLLETDPPPPTQWLARLAPLPTLQKQLHSIWSGLTQEEQMILIELQKGNLASSAPHTTLYQMAVTALAELARKGICQRQGDTWTLFGTLFADYIARVEGRARGRIWWEAESQRLYLGQQVLDNLTTKETDVLQFLAQNPRKRLTYTEVIVAAWSDEENYTGVSNEALFQVIRGLRRKIEPDPAAPIYVVNWRGKPEGGYIFFPEGRPS